MRSSQRLALAAMLLACAATAAAGGWGWAANSHGHHRHDGLRLTAHGSHVAIGLSLPLHRTRVYPAPVRRYYRAPPAVVQRPPPTHVHGRLRPAASRGLPRHCRRFDTSIVIGGRPQAAWGIACRGADGAWHVVD